METILSEIQLKMELLKLGGKSVIFKIDGEISTNIMLKKAYIEVSESFILLHDMNTGDIITLELGQINRRVKNDRLIQLYFESRT